MAPAGASLPCLAAAALFASSLQLQAQNRGGKPVPVAAAAAAGDRIFQTTKLHRIHVSVSAAEWAVLQTSSVRGAAVARRAPADRTTPTATDA